VDGQIVKLHPHAFIVVTASGRGMLENVRLQQLLGQGAASAGKQGPPSRRSAASDRTSMPSRSKTAATGSISAGGSGKEAQPSSGVWSLPDPDRSVTGAAATSGAAGAQAPSAMRRQVWRRPRMATE